MVAKITSGAMFDFYVTETSQNFTEQEKNCRDIGYDGLAVISTPEAFVYALQLIRTLARQDIFIGAHYRPEAGITMWDDNTIPRSDTPFVGSTTSPVRIQGRLTKDINLRMGQGHFGKPGLCGNHKNYPTESSGTTLRGELQTSVRTVLSVCQVFSYLECAVICGMVHECRAAEFNSDPLICTVIGEYTSSGHNANPQVVTYIRKTF
ncbi:hypothetical protein RRG08_039140 [Elysia crispata]|uniref:C-type lectin domain-containing protein n=1 Tax=Elysia crispata TaxID=231223 RepID=A0AAE1D149_9GAST|nr:hypothetical protein RRG08_039140 [Elysia crispata]